MNSPTPAGSGVCRGGSQGTRGYPFSWGPCSLSLRHVVNVYITLNPEPSERFTEFYILGPGGKAYGYPENVTAGENVELIVGVVNREY